MFFCLDFFVAVRLFFWSRKLLCLVGDIEVHAKSFACFLQFLGHSLTTRQFIMFISVSSCRLVGRTVEEADRASAGRRQAGRPSEGQLTLLYLKFVELRS